MIAVHDLPLVNALLNATTATLLVLGYVAIRGGKVGRHKVCMGAAFAVSTVFLASYLTYHANVGSIRFTAVGWPRTVYFTILLTHTILAAAVVPLVLVTLWRARRARFDSHRRIARGTLPIWLYVSVTGVLVYLMLYVIFPSAELA
ncbi:MAG TPA: DUF420 domain-containing protein [Gemmatimonadota bacterium]|nr:DUF420 domain-containing protein [Gemmatimonadota bacterium]